MASQLSKLLESIQIEEQDAQTSIKLNFLKRFKEIYKETDKEIKRLKVRHSPAVSARHSTALA